MSEISAKMSEICYKSDLYTSAPVNCLMKLCWWVIMKTLAVAQHHWYPHYGTPFVEWYCKNQRCKTIRSL